MTEVKKVRMDVLNSDRIGEVDDERLQKLYCWVDEIPLSRPKKNMARDFSDGVLIAEVIKYYVPKLVEVHNYASANSTRQKESNWHLLNRKVLPKLRLELSQDVIRDVALSKPWFIEHVLMKLREKIDLYLARQHRGQGQDDLLSPSSSDKPEADQYNRDHYHPAGDGWAHGGNEVYQPHGHMASPQKPMKPMPWMSNTANPAEMVPKPVLDEREKELSAKQEVVEILQAKIQRLEHLCHLKDIRIEDLSAKLEELEKQLSISSIHPSQAKQHKQFMRQGQPHPNQRQGPPPRQPPAGRWQ